MRVRRFGLLLLTSWVTTWGLATTAAGPDTPPTPCAIEGFVSHDGAPASAEVRVYRRGTLPSHWRDWWDRREYIESWLRLPDGVNEPIARAKTNDEGFYRVEGLAPGRYRVLAVGATSLRAGAIVPLEVPGQCQQVELALRKSPHAASGRIRDALGKPVQGHVFAYPDDVYLPHGSEAKPIYEQGAPLSADGSFVLNDLPEGSLTLVVIEPGRAMTRLPLVMLPHDGPLHLTLEAAPHPTSVHVFDVETDRGIPGARLSWIGWWPHRQCVIHTANDTGHATLPFVNRRMRYVLVQAPGYGSRQLKSFGGTDVRIPMRKAARITGVIRSEAGTPLPGIRVHVDYIDWENHAFVGEPPVTDAKGQYAIENLDWGTVQLHARGGPWIPKGDAQTEVPLEAGKSVVVDFTMVPGGVLRAHIADEYGVPAVGAAVMIQESDDSLFAWKGRDPPPSGATDDKGNVDIIGVVPDLLYDIEVRIPGMPILKKKARSYANGGRRNMVLADSLAAARALRVPNGRTGDSNARWIHVTVLDHDTKAPIAHATIGAMVNEQPGHSHRHPTSWKSGRDGKARVGPLRPLTGQLDIWAAGYTRRPMLKYEVPTREGRPMRVLMRRELDIYGQVVKPDGSPASGAVVVTNELEGSNYWGQVRTNQRGHFRVPRVRGPFRYELSAYWHDDVRKYEVRVEAVGGTTDNVLRLAPVPGSEAVRREELERLQLVLVDEAGAPVTNVSVDVGGVTSRIDAKGVVRFAKPLHGDMPLEIHSALAADGHPRALGAYHLASLGSTTGRRTIVLPAERTIHGRVVDAAGKGVARVRLRAVPARVHQTDPPDLPFVHDTAWTEPDGSFRLGRLAQEPYVLDLTLSERHLAPTKLVRVTPSPDATTIALRDPCTWTLRILDATGHPVADGNVVLYYEGWSSSFRRGWEREQIAAAWGDTDAEGRVTLANLDPQRTYYVHLEAPDPDNVDFRPPRPRDLIGTRKPTSSEWTVHLPSKRK